MWQFFAIVLPIILGVVTYMLHHYASPKVSLSSRIVVGYGWLISLSIVLLVPVDIWMTICEASGAKHVQCGSRIAIVCMWSLAYWSAFFLTWAIIPIIQGYEDAGDFTVKERFKTSARNNLIFYVSVGVIGVIGIIILLAMDKMSWMQIRELAIGASNAFGLITGALLLGYGLVEVPRGLWRHADFAERHKWLGHKVARVAEKLDAAHRELSTAIVIAQATATQMSRRDVLRPMMDIIDAMANEDPTFKPSGGQIGENDMDYDTDEKSMAALRRRLRNAQDGFYRHKTEYTAVVWQTLELEDTLKNADEGCAAGRRFVSSLRPQRKGHLAAVLDVCEWIWRCLLRQQLVRTSAVVLGIMSVAIVFAEATLLIPPNGPDLSLFSVLIQAAGSGLQERLVQLLVCIPLAYICVCTYFSVFKLGMFSFYYLVPGHTDAVSLLMNCSMVSRYAAPMCYNFLSLIHLTTRDHRDLKTTFEKRMGALLLPRNFDRIYPLVMVVYSVLILSNVHNRVMDVFGSWRAFRFETDEEEEEEGNVGESQAGVAILRREHQNLERGMAVGENIVPLARHFNSDSDLEAATYAGRNDKASGVPNAAAAASKGAVERNGSSPLLTALAVKGASPPLGPKEARDMMASLHQTLKNASPLNPAPFELPAASAKDLIAAKYSSKRGGGGGGDRGGKGGSARLPRNFSGNLVDGLSLAPPRESTGDMGALARDPAAQSGTMQSQRAQRPWPSSALPAAGVSESPPGSRSPVSPVGRDGRSEMEGLLESRWDKMTTAFKGLTSKVGSGWKGDSPAWMGGKDVLPLTQSRAAGGGGGGSQLGGSGGGGAQPGAPSLDKIFEGLRSSRRRSLDDDDGEDYSHSSLMAGRRGTQGGTFTSAERPGR